MRAIFALFVLFVLADRSAAGVFTPDPPYVEQKPTYTVDKRTNEGRDLKDIAATVVPPDLVAQAQAQSKLTALLAAKPEAKRLGANTTGTSLPGCNTSAKAFDWRTLGAVSKVKDQGRCGDCFIFASTAAFESSWYLQNHENISVSEQQILDCSSAGGCEGGWHGNVFDFIKKYGVASDNQVPYTGHASGKCVLPNKRYSAVNWNYIDKNGSVASPSAIKTALCAHGPVVSAVYASDDFIHYTGGVFNEFQDGEGASSVNHDVLIVGWDDSQQSWIIKNSWGSEGWGEAGFMRIRYRSNWIGQGAAWIDAVKIQRPKDAEELKEAAHQSNKLNNDTLREAISDLKREGNKDQADHLNEILNKNPLNSVKR